MEPIGLPFVRKDMRSVFTRINEQVGKNKKKDMSCHDT